MQQSLEFYKDMYLYYDRIQKKAIRYNKIWNATEYKTWN